MTKPSDFILNSDYLSLAQTGSTEFTAYFAQATLPAGQPYTQYQDFSAKGDAGGIDMYLVSLNGSDYAIGPEYVSSVVNPFLSVIAFRISPTKIRVQLHGYSSSGYNMPMQTVKLKVSSFKAPNVL